MAAALAHADVERAMAGKPQKRVVVVPNRLVNVVVAHASPVIVEGPIRALRFMTRRGWATEWTHL